MSVNKLTPELIARVEADCLMLLLAERDCYNQWVFNGKLAKMPPSFNLSGPQGGGYAAEAFGVLRGLVLAGFCYYETTISPADRTNANWWFAELQKKALEEERLLGLNPAYTKYKAAVSGHADADALNALRVKAAVARVAKMGPHDVHDPGDEAGLK